MNTQRAALPPQLVKEAQDAEIAECRWRNVYTKVRRSDAFAYTGKPPIGVRWVISNKGDVKHPEVRARLVAKEIKRDKREDLFAATPPLEAKKALFSQCVSRKAKSGKRLKLRFIDIKRAYFHSPSLRDVFVDLPEEDLDYDENGEPLAASLICPCMGQEMPHKIGRQATQAHSPRTTSR